MHKLATESSGFQKQDTEPQAKLSSLEVYVVSVSIKLNVQNGGSDMNDLVSGEALLKLIERTLEENVT